MTRMRNSLQSRLANTPWNEDELKKKCGALWHETKGGTLMIRIDQVRGEMNREFLRTIGQEMYGKVSE